MVAQLQGHSDCTILRAIIVTHFRLQGRESIHMNIIIVNIAPNYRVECGLKYLYSCKRHSPSSTGQVAIDCGATAMNM